MTDRPNHPEVSDSEGEQASPPTASEIVVGLDGSVGSLPALRWAVHEAQLRGAAVRAIMAWQQPAAYGSSTRWSLGADPSVGTKEDLALAARAEMARLQEETGPHHDVEISYEAVEGHPAEVLLSAGRNADLLVVGSRGHGGFAGALLGSVSQHLVQHARCPVTVVPHPDRRTAPDRGRG